MIKQILNDLIPREEAVEMLIKVWNPRDKKETVELEKAFGRVAAEDVLSRNTLPVYRASMADGIAVRMKDFEKEMPDTESWVKGRNYVQADTGDDFPDEFDTVIRIEDVEFNKNGGFVIAPGVKISGKENIRSRGAMIEEGELILKKFMKVREVHLASLAAGGITELTVYKKPKVVFIPTGNELVARGSEPRRGENVEANGIMVKARLEEAGADVFCCDIVKDNLKLLENAVNKAVKEADIVVICAGTAKGEEDYTHLVLNRCATVLQHGILTAPGRPVAFAIAGNKPVINIPGPTIGAYYAVDLCVVPFVNRLLHQPLNRREALTVKLENDIKTVDFMEVIIRMAVTVQNGDYFGTSIPMSVSLAAAMRDCNALLKVPIGVSGYKKGEDVKVELLYEQSGIPEQKEERK